MHFRYRGRVDGLFLNTGESASFRYDDPGGPVLVTLRGPTKEERADGSLGGNGFFSYELELEPPAEVHKMFESLADGKMPAGSKSPSEGVEAADGSVQLFPSVAEDGTIKDGTIPPEQLLPEAFHAFVEHEVYPRTIRYLLGTVGVVRWRFAMEGRHSPVVTDVSSYSLDGETWHPMPGGLYARAMSRSASRISNELRDQIQEIVTQGRAEPLGHELLREARVNESLNARSALILAVAAAEAGTKQCISEIVPNASWLVETGPSPGLVDMLKNYLPSLPCKGKINGQVPTIPKAVRRVLDNAVKQRNKLVHVGMGQPTDEEVRETLAARSRQEVWKRTSGGDVLSGC